MTYFYTHSSLLNLFI